MDREGDRPAGHHAPCHQAPNPGPGGGRNCERGNNGADGSMGPMGGVAVCPTASGYPAEVHFWCNFGGPPMVKGHIPPPYMIEGMKAYLLNVGYPPKAVSEIIAASNILASYGVLKPGNMSIFNTPQIQQAPNQFNTMSGNVRFMGMGNMSGIGSMDGGGWNSSSSMGIGRGQQRGRGGGGMFNKFEGGASNRGGLSSVNMSDMGRGRRGNNSALGGYGKADSGISNGVKRRF